MRESNERAVKIKQGLLRAVFRFEGQKRVTHRVRRIDTKQMHVGGTKERTGENKRTYEGRRTVEIL